MMLCLIEMNHIWDELQSVGVLFVRDLWVDLRCLIFTFSFRCCLITTLTNGFSCSGFFLFDPLLLCLLFLDTCLFFFIDFFLLFGLL